VTSIISENTSSLNDSLQTIGD
jgi:hypothetical protein